MSHDEFKKIVADYEGEIVERPDDPEYLAFVHDNVIKDFYEDGSLHRRAKVTCTVYIDHHGAGAEEKTCEILGGECGSEATKDEIVRLLTRFCFKKKSGYEQLSFI